VSRLPVARPRRCRDLRCSSRPNHSSECPRRVGFGPCDTGLIYRVNRGVPGGARRCGAARHHGAEQISGRDVATTVLSTRRHAGRQYQVGPDAILLSTWTGTCATRLPRTNQLRGESHELRTFARRRHGASSRVGRATVMRLANASWHGYAEVCRPNDGEPLLECDAGHALNEFPDTSTDLYRDSYLGMIDAALARERRGSPAALDSAERDARLLVTLARYVPTPILDSRHRKAFGLPAPGSRATAGVVRGATR
jgi:hypothetical protein